jgi:prepilin-type processing-associated H-X9-DG protein
MFGNIGGYVIQSAKIASMGRPIASIPEPARTGLMTEVIGYGNPTEARGGYYLGWQFGAQIQSLCQWWPEVQLRHSDGANILYCDGHVKWHRYTSGSSTPVRTAVWSGISTPGYCRGIRLPGYMEATGPWSDLYGGCPGSAAFTGGWWGPNRSAAPVPGEAIPAEYTPS